MNYEGVFSLESAKEAHRKGQLSDGSHRHEALVRSGFGKYWVVFLFTKEESKKLLEIE